jgi:hypothetical protein
MALFTRENAVAMGKLSAERRKEAKERQEREHNGLPPISAPAEDQRRRDRVQKQIDRCDDLLENCRSAKTFIQLTAAKERLWNLVYPKPGSLRPKQSRQERAPVVPLSPQPVAMSAPIVAPVTDQNHKSEIVQS